MFKCVSCKNIHLPEFKYENTKKNIEKMFIEVIVLHCSLNTIMITFMSDITQI